MHRPVQRMSPAAFAALLAVLALGPPAGAATVQPRLGDVPFPNDVFTVADAHSPTGRRVHFVQAAMPANAKGVHIDPHAWNWSDGFSPGRHDRGPHPGPRQRRGVQALEARPDHRHGARASIATRPSS